MRYETPAREELSDLCTKSVKSDGTTRSKEQDGTQVTDEILLGGYTFWILDQISPYWEIRFYDLPRGDSPQELEDNINKLSTELQQWGVTVAWSAKNIVAVKIMDSKGKPRKWMDLQIFAAQGVEKLAKRMTVLGAQRYLFTKSKVVFIGEGERMEPRDGIISIQVRKPVDDYEAIIVDGISFMRPSTLGKMTDNLHNVIMDPARREQVIAETAFERRFNIRFITPLVEIEGRVTGGEGKGDAIVVKQDNFLPADFVTWDINFKPEFYGAEEEVGYLIAQPQEQQRNVRTNTQLLCHFGFLFPGKRLETDLSNEIDRKAEKFCAGETDPGVFHKREGHIFDSLHTQHQKFKLFADAGLPMGASLKLQSMQAELLKSTYAPATNKGNETRKFPMERAVRVSLSSEFDAKTSGYLPERFNMPYAEATVIDEIGFVMSDDLYTRVATVLGGADKDDHVYVIPYIAGSNTTIKSALGDPEINIRQGEVILVVIRSPIGFGSNGIETASEYFIFKATKQYAKKLMRIHEALPLLDLRNRPNIIDEIEYPEDSFASTPRADASADYTFGEFLNVVRHSVGVGKAYGDHANVMMVAALYRIPLSHFAPEEVFIDVQQKPNKVDVDRMTEITNIHVGEIVREMRRRNQGIDALLRHRLRFLLMRYTNLPNNLTDPNGPFVRRAQWHIAQVQRLNKEMADHLLGTELPRHKAMVTDINVTIMKPGETNGMPLIIRRQQEIEARLRNEWNYHSGKLNYRQWASIGNELVEIFKERNTPREIIIQAMYEAWAWCIKTTGYSNSKLAEEILRGTDAPLMHGALITYYLEMLREEYPRRNS